MLYYLITGLSLGLSSGLSPGPLFALVIYQTLNYGKREGVKVAITPLITDIPIILFSYFIIDIFASNRIMYGILALSGGLFIAWLAYESFKIKEIKTVTLANTRSIRKGVITNLLNPAPYMFWITVGIPTVLKGYTASIVHALLFVVSFYLCLVGSKITLAVLVGRSGKVNPRVLRYINIVLGFVLAALAVKFIYDGIGYFR
jgi:threonine/homoserine/homoserine lactone efflux protein